MCLAKRSIARSANATDAVTHFLEKVIVSAELTIRKLNDVSVVDIFGRIVLGQSSNALRDAVAGLLAGGERNIILNLGAVNYLDSAGLGELVRSATTVSSHGGKLKLLSATKRVKDLMRLTGIAQLFDAYDDERLALESFAPTRSSA